MQENFRKRQEWSKNFQSTAMQALHSSDANNKMPPPKTSENEKKRFLAKLQKLLNNVVELGPETCQTVFKAACNSTTTDEAPIRDVTTLSIVAMTPVA